MPAKHRTQPEQKFWDEVFQERYSACLREVEEGRAIDGCAQLAAEQSDAALAARRSSARADR